jgi:protein SCO1/2
MKSVIAGICLMIMCSAAFGADRAPVAKATEKSEFTLEMVSGANELKSGSNTIEFIVRDKKGKAVEGADLSVTPWLPAMGHGVWDKPVVTELGAGKYSVKNIVTTMNGRWELRVVVKKGTHKDQLVFPFDVTGKETASRKEADQRKGNYARSVKYYSVPNIMLLNQDGKKVNLRELVDSGKPVIFDFIYTTCTTICPVLSASFTNLRKELGEDAGKVQLISISIDPENDRPEQMKKYLSRFKAGKGWDFLTGSREDIDRVLKSLDATIIDKMSHEPLYIMRGPHSDDWVRIKGLLSKGDLLNELRRIER